MSFTILLIGMAATALLIVMATILGVALVKLLNRAIGDEDRAARLRWILLPILTTIVACWNVPRANRRATGRGAPTSSGQAQRR